MNKGRTLVLGGGGLAGLGWFAGLFQGMSRQGVDLHDRYRMIGTSAGYHLNDAIAALEASGSKVLVIEPDAAARAAMGANPLDHAVRRPSAEAGFAQGLQLATSVGTIWSSTS